MAEYLDMDMQQIRRLAMEAMQTWRLTAMQQIQEMHTRLDRILHDGQQRFVENDWQLQQTNPMGHEQMEAFYGALDGLREDRQDYQSTNMQALLEREQARLTALELARQQVRGPEQGMSF